MMKTSVDVFLLSNFFLSIFPFFKVQSVGRCFDSILLLKSQSFELMMLLAIRISCHCYLKKNLKKKKEKEVSGEFSNGLP